MADNQYVNFLPGLQSSVIRSLKIQSRLTWPELAVKFGVSRGMVLGYASGKHKIPLQRLQELCNFAELPLSSVGDFRLIESLIEIHNKTKSITLPSLKSPELAEFLGFLAGDGCLTTKYATVISCDATSDRRYIDEVVKKKFETLFSLSPSIRTVNRNLVQYKAYSKNLFTFLSIDCGFPIGEKKGRLRIPEFIKQDRVLSAAFIRGLFDTDGGYHRHNPYSSKVGITSFSKDFLSDVIAILIWLGFKPIKVEEDIFIISKAGVHKFFETIKPHNPKHLYKYAKFMETGQVPRHKDINYHSAEFKNFVCN